MLELTSTRISCKIEALYYSYSFVRQSSSHWERSHVAHTRVLVDLRPHPLLFVRWTSLELEALWLYASFDCCQLDDTEPSYPKNQVHERSNNLQVCFHSSLWQTCS